MAHQPGKTQNHLEVAQGHDLTGKGFLMHALNAHTTSEVVSDGAGSRQTAVNQLNGDGVGVKERVQIVLLEDGGVQEAVRRARVDQGLHRDWRLAGNNQMNHQTKVIWGWVLGPH